MLKFWLLNYLVIFTIAAVVSYLSGFLVKFLAVRFKVIDQPNSRKIHIQSTPRLGGVAIFLGFALSIICISTLLGLIFKAESLELHLSLPPKVWGILLGGLVTLLVGVFDDFKALQGGTSAVGKLFVLFFITLGLSQSGIIVNFPFPYAINLIITLIWLVGVTSTFNAIDHLDGLASGLALIAGLSFLGVAIQTGQWFWGSLAVALVGANLGFLRHNFHPASLFMGDGGSFFLGFTLATLGIMGAWSTNPFKASFIPILILAIPIFDFIWIIIRRQKAGVTRTTRDIITYCGKDHLGHRIMALGFSQGKTAGFIYLIALTTSLGAIILRNTSREEAFLLLVQFILVLSIIFVLIAYLPAKHTDAK